MAEGTKALRPSGQDSASVAANADYFAGERHGQHASGIDTYRFIREALEREVTGVHELLDVGNGGVFEYDASRVDSIVAVDLFLDRLPAEHFPPNVTPRRGDALALDEPEGRYDAVLQAMLFHHLVGRRVAEAIENARTAIGEAARVLRPGGKLIIAEPCVPRWFYGLERMLFHPLRLLARTPLLRGHPATIQMTVATLVGLVSEWLEVERSYEIPRGRRNTLFGWVIPAWIVPSRMQMVVARKRERVGG